jgi:hypothetical protein
MEFVVAEYVTGTGPVFSSEYDFDAGEGALPQPAVPKSIGVVVTIPETAASVASVPASTPVSGTVTSMPLPLSTIVGNPESSPVGKPESPVPVPLPLELLKQPPMRAKARGATARKLLWMRMSLTTCTTHF